MPNPADIPNDPADILILIADDGKAYKIQTQDWRTDAHEIKDEQTKGVLKQLANYGVVVADLERRGHRRRVRVQADQRREAQEAGRVK